MRIDFYTCNCDNRVVDKTNFMAFGETKNCSIYQQTGIMHPSLLLTYSPALVNYNYFSIPDWGRHYYITGMEVMPGGRIVVTGSEDYLYSNKDEILGLNGKAGLEAYVIRTESKKGNKYLSDKLKPVQTNRTCNTIAFPGNHFDATDHEYIYLLTVVGGSSRS